MPNDSKHLEEENRLLEEENRRLEEENRLLEEKNKRLERNKQLREKRKQLEAKRNQLIEETEGLKDNKRKADSAFENADGHRYHHSPAKRTKLHDQHMREAVKMFFSSSHFAVAGASSDPAKYGHKVFVWYLQHKLPVTPINPTAGTVTTMSGPKSMLKRVHLASSSPSRLDAPTKTSLSIITPPKITRNVLEDAKKAGVRAVWLQPGSFDSDVLRFARREWPGAAIAGTDIPGSAGEDGWCILVDGEAGMDIASRRF